MSNITKWTNMCDGFFAFSCEAIDPQGNILEISTFYCWVLKLNFFVEILLIIPFIPLLKLYYQYYGKQWFRSRQRVIYLCLLTLFTSNLSFSVFNVLALYQISFFMSQILFWHVLGYFIIKVEKLASGPIVVSLKVLYWIFLLLFIGYLGAVLIAPLSQDTIFCPGIIDTEFWVYKCVLVAGLVILDVYAGILLRILLSRESESLLDPRDISQRRMDFIKLWTLLIVVSISELCHLIISILYYSNGLDANQCNIIGGDETGTFDAVFALIYRGIIIYAPVLALLWMIWIPDKDVQIHFNESYAEEVFNTDSRYAARLSFKRRSQAHTQSNILLSVANIPPPILEDSEDDR